MRKKIFIFIGVFIFVIIGFMILSSYCRNLNKSEQKDMEERIEGRDKQALILYQESMSSMVKDNVDAITVTLQKANYSVVSNHPRADSDYCIQDYDVIVLVSPVYARKLAQPLLDFADNQDFSGKKVYGVIVGMAKQNGQEEMLKEHIQNAAQKEAFKVIGFDNTQMITNLEGFLSE